MSRLKTCSAAVLLLLCAIPSRAQEVSTWTGGQRPLSERVEWAMGRAEDLRKSDYWVVWGVKRTMEQGSSIGQFSGRWRDLPSIEEVLFDVHRDPDIRNAARKTLENMDRKDAGKLVEKDLAVLIRFRKDTRSPSIQDLNVSNLDLAFDFDGAHIYWLDSATDGESISWLYSEYETSSDADLREDLVSTMAMHDDLDRIHSVLLGAIETDASEDVRETAVFWLSRFETAGNVRYLDEMARNDSSEDIRESAVFALNRIERSDALDALIRLARKADLEDVREQARFWLGQKAVNQLVPADTPDDDESRVQKQAVFALTQMDDEESIPTLIELAESHKNPAVRKQAVFWLGQSEDPRALDAIVSIIKGS